MGRLVAAALVGIALAGCQAPVLRTASASRDLQITFVIAGTGAGTNRQLVPAGRLLLPTARTLRVTLTAAGSAAAEATQTVVLAEGAGQATVSFPDTPVALYTVTAEASDASGVVVFRQTGSADLLRFGDAKIVLNLVPADASLVGQLAPGMTYEGSVAAGSSRSWSVPAEGLSGSIAVLFSTGDPSLLCFVQGADGRLLNADPSSRNIEAALGDGESAFVTLYNTSAAAQGYQFVVNATASVDVAITIDDNLQSLVFSPAALTVAVGHPVTLGSSFAGTNWQWTVNPTVAGTSSGNSFTFSPPTAGTYTVSAVALGSDGTSYSGSLVVTAAPIPTDGLVLALFHQDSGSATVTDTSSSHTDGTVDGTVVPTLDGSGKPAYRFVSGATVTTVSAQTQRSYGQDFSYSLWFSADGLDASGYPPIVSQKTTGSGQFGFLACLRGNQLRAQLNETDWGTNEVAYGLTAATTYHLAVVYTAANQVETVYVDGTPVGTATFALSGNAPGGAGLQFGGTGFAGTIGRFRMYDRALTADEVSVLYRE